MSTASETAEKAPLKRSKLIQRLKPPFKVHKDDEPDLGQKLSEVTGFGGGLSAGGLSSEAMKLLRPIFRFDYMGASEFEWGAVPEALGMLIRGLSPKDPIGSLAVMVSPDEIVGKLYKGNDYEDRTESLKIHVVCRCSMLEQAADRVRELAIDPSEQNPLEDTHLGYRVLYTGPGDDTIGWLELDNGFFATTDETMRNKLLELFQVNYEKA